ncbi:hypothetical protein K227x_01970 [Rubripirellula lacrimiformis]|uniref:SLA1 homology domain-containing protein n=1 Tax=Rubripirellula lacrimiformis TaxID=1930273 RepID=A0A517N3V8_9BACT|nr:SHD1 domain-containing protein [Rubripirellula lacrimiformis]QDT01829.1 hypothetical protein K227x_01970 [Rubripirellula lacrimiformis]
MKIFVQLIIGLMTLAVSSEAMARSWTSAAGGYTLEADEIASSDTSVILKRASGKLVVVALDELSKADQDYIASKEVVDKLRESAAKMQTWTSADGLKIRGRVVAYGRKDLSISRLRGKVVINSVLFERLDPLHQKLVLKIMSELEGETFQDEQGLNRWAKVLGAEPKVYPLEGVLLELETGDRLAVPFFLFSEADLEVLSPGWDAWSKSNDNEAAQAQESLMMQTEARHYQEQRQQQEQQQEQQRDYQRQQIEVLKLNMLAAATGVTSIWEVGLQPPLGAYGRRMSVMVTAQNSDVATRMALAQYPGYRVFGVRKASRF